MKKAIFSLALAALAVFTISFSASAGEDPTPKVEFEKVTVSELKAMYGEDVFRNVDASWLNENDVLLVNAQPCATGGGPVNIACEGQASYIIQQAQIEANACCCLSAWAALCCDNGEVIVIFVEREPNSPLCD